MNALAYAKNLVGFRSVSTDSNQAISDYIDQVLGRLGFQTECVEYDRDGNRKVSVIGCKSGLADDPGGGLAYFAHTDVVPAGDWTITSHGPFEATVQNERLYGRGSTDMKGPLACMLAAAEFYADRDLAHPLYVCCTADEERDHRGINEIIQRSRIFRDLIKAGASGIVGEPTEMQVVYAHKGGVQIRVTSRGRAAHSSTRDGVNANLAMIPFLQEAKVIYDETESDPVWMDDEFDPPSVCVNLGINDHTAAVNVTPPQSVCTLCFRPMPTTQTRRLIDRIREVAERADLDFEMMGENPPFRRDPTSDFATQCVSLIGSSPPSTVSYGTEAGNLSEISNLVVLGPGSIKQAHQSDEWISLEQLVAGEAGYRRLIEHFCL